MDYSCEIFKTCESFLRAEGIEYFPNTDRNFLLFSLPVSGKYCINSIDIRLVVYEDYFTVVATTPDLVPEKNSSLNAASLASYINEYQKIGAFRASMITGEISYFLTVLLEEGSVPSHELCRRCLDAVMLDFTKFADAFRMILSGEFDNPWNCYQQAIINYNMSKDLKS